MEQGQAALARQPSPRHQRPHGLPASRQVSEARRPGDVPTQRGPEGPGTPVPATPHSPAPSRTPPQESSSSKGQSMAGGGGGRCWTHAAAAGPTPPRDTLRPAAPVRPEPAPGALCRVRLARHARRAPRSVPQRHGQPGTTAAKQDLRRCFIRTWPLENSRAGGRPLAAHLWAGGWHTPSGAPQTSPVFTRAAVARSLPGSLQGVSPAPSATLRGACLGCAGGDARLPPGVLLRGGLLGGFILTWTLVPEMAPACQAHPNLGGLTALGGTSRGQPPPLGVPGWGLSCSQTGAQINTSLEVPGACGGPG